MISLNAISYADDFSPYTRRGWAMGALFSSFFASAGTTGFLAFLGVWLHDSFGVSGGKVGLVFLVCGSASLFASPLICLVADRIGT